MDDDKVLKGDDLMAIRTREELLDSIKTRVGEQTDDETIAFLEDVTDTLTDFETRANGGGEDWKTKYKENDEAWRKKYTERFFSNEPTPTPEPTPEPTKPKTFEELFK